MKQVFIIKKQINILKTYATKEKVFSTFKKEVGNNKEFFRNVVIKVKNGLLSWRIIFFPSVFLSMYLKKKFSRRKVLRLLFFIKMKVVFIIYVTNENFKHTIVMVKAFSFFEGENWIQ